MASASTAGSGGGRVEARAPVHMSFVVNGASGAARRATKFVRSAREAVGVASDNIASARRARGLGRDFGRCMLLRAHKLLFRAVLCQILPAIGSSDLSRLVAALVLSAITFALSKQGRTKMTVPKNSAELETKRRLNLENHPSYDGSRPPKTPRGGRWL